MNVSAYDRLTGSMSMGMPGSHSGTNTLPRRNPPRRPFKLSGFRPGERPGAEWGNSSVWAFLLVLAVAVLGCIAASATFAFEFGWTRGATDIHRWTYANAGVALDLLKSGLPIFGALAWQERKPARAVICLMVFVVLT